MDKNIADIALVLAVTNTIGTLGMRAYLVPRGDNYGRFSIS